MSEDTLRRAVAEMIGAFTLTFIGAGAAAAAGPDRLAASVLSPSAA